MEFVHLGCLKHWVDSKRGNHEEPTGPITHFNFRKLSCELCKQTLPYVIHIENNDIELIKIPRPESTPYIILEKFENNKENMGLYLIQPFQQRPIQIGRGHNNDILVSDISVSRVHGCINYANGNFYILDRNSKFGTLISVRDKMELPKDVKIMFQIGKTVVNISVVSPQISSHSNLPSLVPEENKDPGTPSTSNDVCEEEDMKRKKEEGGIVNKKIRKPPKTKGKRKEKDGKGKKEREEE